jgi:hypothetical protein
MRRRPYVAEGVKMQDQYGTGPVDGAGQQQAYQQCAGEIALRAFKFRCQMGKGFKTDKTPEHHRQGGEKL